MAHNTLIRGTGILADWPFGDPVQPDEFLALDLAQFKSINGDEGGTWAPSNPIIIGGSGLDLTTELVLEAGGVGGDTTPYIEGIHAPVAWKLLADWGSTGVHAREYYQNTGGRGFLWTVNAEYDGATWDRDTGGADALALELNGAEVAIRTASVGDPFASWSDAIVFNPTNPAVTAGNPRTLYPMGIPAAWGHVITDGGGAFSVDNGFGISAIANSSGDALFTLTNAMAAANYVVLVTGLGDLTDIQFGVVDIVSTTQFKVRIWNESAGTFGQYDQSGDPANYSVLVFGKVV